MDDASWKKRIVDEEEPPEALMRHQHFFVRQGDAPCLGQHGFTALLLQQPQGDTTLDDPLPEYLCARTDQLLEHIGRADGSIEPCGELRDG